MGRGGSGKNKKTERTTAKVLRKPRGIAGRTKKSTSGKSWTTYDASFPA
jgi:uncharacterized membrane protein